MNTNRKSAVTVLFVAVFLISVLVGCSGRGAESNSTPSPSANEDASAATETTATETETTAAQESNTEYPIVIKHAFGETIIESKPERVATIQWANHDIALALGVVPVGFSASNYGVQDDSGLLPWTAQKLKELGVDTPNVFQDTDGLDFEAISDTNPDVILAAYSGITQEDYDILSKIAPVVAYPTSPWVTKWREQILINATGLGMKAEGEQLVKDTENLIKEKVSAFPKIAGKKVVLTYISVEDLSKIWIYTPGDPRAAFLLDLGMIYPESVTNEIKDDSFALEISAENADILNEADLLITYNAEGLLEALQADPLFGKVPAIERGSVVMIGDNTPLAASINPNPLSISYTTDEYLGLIGEAVNKIDD